MAELDNIFDRPLPEKDQYFFPFKTGNARQTIVPYTPEQALEEGVKLNPDYEAKLVTVRGGMLWVYEAREHERRGLILAKYWTLGLSDLSHPRIGSVLTFFNAGLPGKVIIEQSLTPHIKIEPDYPSLGARHTFSIRASSAPAVLRALGTRLKITFEDDDGGVAAPVITFVRLGPWSIGAENGLCLKRPIALENLSNLIYPDKTPLRWRPQEGSGLLGKSIITHNDERTKFIINKNVDEKIVPFPSSRSNEPDQDNPA